MRASLFLLYFAVFSCVFCNFLAATAADVSDTSGVNDLQKFGKKIEKNEEFLAEKGIKGNERNGWLAGKGPTPLFLWSSAPIAKKDLRHLKNAMGSKRDLEGNEVDFRVDEVEMKEIGDDLRMNAVDLKEKMGDVASMKGEMEGFNGDLQGNEVNLKVHGVEMKVNEADFKGNEVDLKQNRDDWNKKAVDDGGNVMGLKDFGEKKDVDGELEGWIYQNAQFDQDEIATFVLNSMIGKVNPDDEARFGFQLGNTDTLLLYLINELSINDVSKANNAFKFVSGADDDSKLFLKTISKDSARTVIIPRIFKRGSNDDPWRNFIKISEALNFKTMVVDAGSIATNEVNDFFADGERKRLFIVFDEGETFDHSLDRRIQNAYTTVTNMQKNAHPSSSFVTIVTGLRPKTNDYSTPDVQSRKSLSSEKVIGSFEDVLSKPGFKVEGEVFTDRELADEYVTIEELRNSVAFIRSDPNLITSMILSLGLFIFTLVYLCCIDCVEPPTSFISRYPFKGKEFN